MDLTSIYITKFLCIFIAMKQSEKKVISLAIDKELLKKIDEANFNRSKLIDSLLTKHYVKKEK